MHCMYHVLVHALHLEKSLSGSKKNKGNEVKMFWTRPLIRRKTKENSMYILNPSFDQKLSISSFPVRDGICQFCFWCILEPTQKQDWSYVEPKAPWVKTTSLKKNSGLTKSMLVCTPRPKVRVSKTKSLTDVLKSTYTRVQNVWHADGWPVFEFT